MPLQAFPIISDISAPQKDSLLQSTASQQNAQTSLFFENDVNLLSFTPVLPSNDPTIGFWVGATIPAENLVLGVGNVPEPPTGGTFALAYDGDSTGLTALAFDIAALDLQTALNANPTIAAIPDTVVVTLLAVGVYQIAFQATGARLLLTGDATNLTPECNVFVRENTVGDGSNKEVQAIQLVERPFVFVNSWTLSPSASVIVTTLSNGSDTTLANYVVTLPVAPYAGTFQLIIDDQSFSIAFNATASGVQQIIGTTWTVTLVTATQWAIQQTVEGAHTLTADVGSLQVFISLMGTLQFNGPALFDAFLPVDGEAVDSIETTLKIRYQNDDFSEIDTLLNVPVTISADILTPAATAPSSWNAFYLTAVQVNALIATLNSFDADIIDTSGTTTITKLTGTTKNQTIAFAIANFGSPGTNVVVLDVTGCVAGDMAFLPLVFASGSSNSTIEVRNATDTGTLLHSVTGDPSQTFTNTPIFVFTGSAWRKIGIS